MDSRVSCRQRCFGRPNNAPSSIARSWAWPGGLWKVAGLLSGCEHTSRSTKTFEGIFEHASEGRHSLTLMTQH